jgi:hypothetical protein
MYFGFDIDYTPLTTSRLIIKFIYISIYLYNLKTKNNKIDKNLMFLDHAS